MTKTTEGEVKNSNREKLGVKPGMNKAKLRRLNPRKWRLIVRNLPFKASESEMREIFGKFGTLSELIIPQKMGRSVGYGFVQFERNEDATKALQSVNATEVKGRTVAVDWAIPKDQYMTSVMEETEAKKQKSVEKPPELPNVTITIKSAKGVKKEEPKESESESEEEESDEDASGSDSEEEESEEEEKTTPKAIAKPNSEATSSNDVEEGKTLFVRNLSFDTDDEKLKTHFTQFGEVGYAVVCRFPDTTHSKGTGFVKFVKKEDSDKCLEQFESQQFDLFRLDDRSITVSRAIKRTEAKEMEKKKHEKNPKDNRNLHLLRLSLIRAGSQQAEGMSQADVSKRLKVEAANRLKLKNLHIFVSPTRLCIHNLPKRVGGAELKKLCLTTLNDPTARIKECRVMRDLTQLDANGEGRSKGFAFVEFIHHHHALECLKRMNNNADIFGPLKRPIVEFSLENRTALNKRQKRYEKSLEVTAALKKEAKPMKKSNTSVATVVAPMNGPVDKKMKAMPSHMGPKIRHNRRSDQSVKKGKKPKGKLSRKQVRSAKSGKVPG